MRPCRATDLLSHRRLVRMASMDHLARLRGRLRGLPLLPPPSPWESVATHAVGGLTEVGFAAGTDLLLVVSHSGRGVFDGRTGERLARDPGEPSAEWYDPVRLSAEGVGPLAGVTVRLAGLHGGGLPVVTADGWSVQVAYPDWPDGMAVLEPPGRSVFVDHLAGGCVRFADLDVPWACGFSETGQSLVVAESHTLRIFTREGAGG
jgi:hypothetical protein